MRKFEDGFMVGASTAAHQVEGNNVNSDFWVMENIPGSTYKEPSLDAVDHYNRYREDIKILAESGLNAYRFSIEWARIEPSRGKFDSKEIEHYKDVLECCYEYGVTPIVTLHHFSSPRWLISEGGWESETTIEYFAEYCKYVISELGYLMTYVCTINEANMGVQIARIMKKMKDQMAKAEVKKAQGTHVQVGLNMDQPTSRDQYFKACGEAFGIDPRQVQVFLAPRTSKGNTIIMKCHQKAREVIKSINPSIQVGITMSLYDYQAVRGGEEYAKAMQEEDFINYLPYIEEDDFFGVQNYTRKICAPEGIVLPDERARMTEANNEYYPEALGGVIRFVSEYWKKPILVTENGVSTSNDKDRIEFIERAIKGLYECVEEGINVIGYMHWSLLDNFEWQLGYAQKFGLIAVDRSTQIRVPKESLQYLGSINKFGFKTNSNFYRR